MGRHNLPAFPNGRHLESHGSLSSIDALNLNAASGLLGSAENVSYANDVADQLTQASTWSGNGIRLSLKGI